MRVNDVPGALNLVSLAGIFTIAAMSVQAHGPVKVGKLDQEIEGLKKSGFGGESYLDLHYALRWIEEHPGQQPMKIPANQRNAFTRRIADFIKEQLERQDMQWYYQNAKARKEQGWEDLKAGLILGLVFGFVLGVFVFPWFISLVK